MAEERAFDLTSESHQATSRDWIPAGENFPGVYVSSISPADVVVSEEQRERSQKIFWEKYDAAAAELFTSDDG